MAQSMNEKLKTLMQISDDPCLSFFIPVESVGADTQQGAVNLKKLLRQAEEALKSRGMRSKHIEPLLEPLKELVEDVIFWQHQKEGLALFVSPANTLDIWQLPIKVNLDLAVMDRFNIRPLLPLLAQDGFFYLLALGRKDTMLFNCSREGMEALTVEGLPDSLKAIYKLYESEKHLQHHSSSGSGSGSGSSVIHGGASSVKDEEKHRIEEYFRMIDASLSRQLPDPKTPLVLACVDYLFPIYKQISKAGTLMDGHLAGSPDLSDPDKLRKQAWDIVAPVFAKPKNKAWEKTGHHRGSSQVITDIRLIMAAAGHGRVEALFIKDQASLWGWYDKQSGAIKKADPDDPDRLGQEDLIDLAARKVLESGGQAYSMSEDEMDDEADFVALLRY